MLPKANTELGTLTRAISGRGLGARGSLVRAAGAFSSTTVPCFRAWSTKSCSVTDCRYSITRELKLVHSSPVMDLTCAAWPAPRFCSSSFLRFSTARMISATDTCSV